MKVECYDIENDCTGCLDQAGCSLFEEAMRTKELIEVGVIGEIIRPDGSKKFLFQDSQF